MPLMVGWLLYIHKQLVGSTENDCAVFIGVAQDHGARVQQQHAVFSSHYISYALIPLAITEKTKHDR